MALDPNIALGVRGIELQNPLAQYGQIASIQNAQNQNALAQFQLESAKRQDMAQNALSAAYQKGVNADTGEINNAMILKSLAQGGAGHMIPDVQAKLFKSQQEQAALKKTNVETTGLEFKQRIDKANKAISDIAALNSPEEAMASIDQHLAKGDIDQQKADLLKGQLAQAPNFGAWQKGMLVNILDAKEKLTLTAPKPVEVNLNNKKIFLDLNPNSPTFQKEVAPAQTVGMTPFEAGRLPILQQQANTSAGQLKVAQDRLLAESATGVLSPESLELAANLYAQTGTLPQLGIGKGAANVKSQIMNRAAQLTMGDGTSAADAATNLAAAKQDTGSRTQAVKAFATGKQGQQVTAFNTAIDHLSTMSKLSDALQNNDIKAFNSLGNTVARQTGQPAPTNFDAAKQIVTAEIIKAVVASGGGVKERQEAENNFAAASSPEQLKGVINTYKQLLGGQLNSLNLQYENTTGRKDFDKKLTPDAKAELNKLRGAEKPAAAATGIDLSNPLLK